LKKLNSKFPKKNFAEISFGNVIYAKFPIGKREDVRNVD